MTQLLQLLVSSLTPGAVYTLVAIGLVLVFKASDLINFGQGEWVLAGAYIGLTFLLAGLPLWLVLVISPLAGALMGYLLDLIVFRQLVKASPWVFVVASLGLGGLLRQIVQAIYQSNIYPFPPVLSTHPFQIGGVFFTPQNLWVVGATLAIVASLYLFFDRTRVGKAMQAVAQNRTGSQIVGINLRAFLSLTWALSAAVSTMAGLLVAPQVGVSPEMGALVIKGFVAAAVGGLDSLGGAVIGGLSVALAEGLTNSYLTSTYKDVVVFGLLLLIMWLRPSGLLGRVVVKRM